MKDKPKPDEQLEVAKERFTLIKNDKWKPPVKRQSRHKIKPIKDLSPAA